MGWRRRLVDNVMPAAVDAALLRQLAEVEVLRRLRAGEPKR